MAQATNYLLTFNKFDLAIKKSLDIIGDITDIDRIYIYENKLDETTGRIYTSQKYEWTFKFIEPQIDNPEFQNVDFQKKYPFCYSLLSKGKSVNTLVRDIPIPEREIFEKADIKSIFIVPIFIKENFWGFIGFDDCTYEKTWSKSEESILYAMEEVSVVHFKG